MMKLCYGVYPYEIWRAHSDHVFSAHHTKRTLFEPPSTVGIQRCTPPVVQLHSLRNAATAVASIPQTNGAPLPLVWVGLHCYRCPTLNHSDDNGGDNASRYRRTYSWVRALPSFGEWVDDGMGWAEEDQSRFAPTLCCPRWQAAPLSMLLPQPQAAGGRAGPVTDPIAGEGSSEEGGPGAVVASHSGRRCRSRSSRTVPHRHAWLAAAACVAR